MYFHNRTAYILSPISTDVKKIPGIKGGGEECLKSDLGGGPIRTTPELILKFISLRGPQMSNADHYNIFMQWLCIKGLAQYKHDIVVAISGKAAQLLLIMLCIQYRAHCLADIEPPE